MSARIAVVEDDPGIAPMLEQILRMEGYQVTIVRDGRAAVAELVSGEYEAAILDVMLPGKDGISILRELRASRQTEDLPVLMLTAKGDDATTWEGWRAGASYYMAKPFDPDELVRVLRSLIAGSSM